MTQSEIYLLIFGMAIVTYLPRVLPAFLMSKLSPGKTARKFLSLLPYTAMAALIFPGIFFVDPGNPLFGILGGITAILLSLKKCPLIFCVLGAVGINCMLYMIL